MEDQEFLQKEVFIILSHHEINSSKKKFWEKYTNNAQKANNFRFVQIKKSNFIHNESENTII